MKAAKRDYSLPGISLTQPSRRDVRVCTCRLGHFTRERGTEAKISRKAPTSGTPKGVSSCKAGAHDCTCEGLLHARGALAPVDPVALQGNRMTREDAFLALLLLLPMAGCAERAPPPLSCVYTEGCGCRIAVQKMSCPDHLDTHLFHELAQGSPLKLDLGQGEILARSSKPLTNYFD